MKDLRAIILAAGKGTRMKSDLPKVLHKVCGVPIIRYILDIIGSLGASKVYIVLGHKSDEVKEELGKDYIYIRQKKLLGTADAVKSVQRQLSSFRGDVLILSGDTPLLKKNVIRALVRRHKQTKASCTLLTSVLHNPAGYGRIIREETNRIVAIREDKDAVGLEKNIAEINVGAYCFKSKDLFAALKEVKMNKKKKEYYLTDIIEIFSQKELKIDSVETESPDEGLGVNTRVDLAKAHTVLQQRIQESHMLAGVSIVDPATTFIGADAKIGRDTVIQPNCYIENGVKIGDKCTVGPFARLREGTRLGNNVTVGNFVEISRSKVGNRTIVKHFGYLGDTNVGTNVNIGAGAVTANYDGKEKHPTKISNNAFIGSDAVLVAPVKIGRKAVVAAGSVVTKGKNVPDNALVMGVPAEVQKKGKKK